MATKHRLFERVDRVFERQHLFVRILWGHAVAKAPIVPPGDHGQPAKPVARLRAGRFIDKFEDDRQSLFLYLANGA